MSSNPLNKAVKAVWSLKKTVPLAGSLMIDPRVARSNKIIFVLYFCIMLSETSVFFSQLSLLFWRLNQCLSLYELFYFVPFL